MTAVQLYTDLLIKALANTIYCDSALVPGQANRAFDSAARHEGKDWPAIAHTMVGIRRLENLRDLTQRVLDEGVPGHLIETGVWRGGCCILMRGVLAANRIKDRKVYVADSFEGLPKPRMPQDEGDILYQYSELSVSEKEVRDNFQRYGLLDDQVAFVPGLFQDTLSKLNVSPFALLRLDGDMYESTYLALEHLYPRLSVGGFVIIDDYGCIPACKQAVNDYCTHNAVAVELNKIDWTGIWWRKSSSMSGK